jgi:uncharacterized membrane protein YgdD (TMEM256/DUF423 family)
VLAGAFGAHGLQGRIDETSLKVWQTSVTYHLAHAIALVLVGLLAEQRKQSLRGAQIAFGLGILLFSGSLYALALTGVRALGMITPFGGISFLVGWVLVACSSAKN